MKKIIQTIKLRKLKIERHNKEYSLVAEGLTDIAGTRINYYPMCGRELKGTDI